MDEKIIWIIDDDMVAQFAMKYKIEQSYKNHTIIGFYTVEEAISTIEVCLKTKKDLPNIILLDLVLPTQDGWYFLEELEKIQGHIDCLDIYVVSAFSNSTDRKRVKEHPMVKGYFDKPLNKGSVDQMFLFSKKES